MSSDCMSASRIAQEGDSKVYVESEKVGEHLGGRSADQH